MIRKVMVIATATGAAVAIAVLSNQSPQMQGATQASVAQASPTQAGPAQVRPRLLMPGDILPADEIEFIEHPGRYGLGTELRGSRYAIVDGHLVRIDPETMELQSILRKDSVALD